MIPLPIRPANGDWKADANCRGTDWDAFFPDDGHNVSSTVKRVCGNCTVRSECLGEALATSAQGYWGGTSENQRRRMLRLLKGQAVDELVGSTGEEEIAA